MDGWPQERAIRISAELTPLQAELTLWHEMGHALGLEHTPRAERISIMNPGWEEPFGRYVSAADRARVER